MAGVRVCVVGGEGVCGGGEGVCGVELREYVVGVRE